MVETIVLQTDQKNLFQGEFDPDQGTISNLQALKELKDYAHFTFNQNQTILFASKSDATDSQIDIFKLENLNWVLLSQHKEENIQITGLTFDEENRFIYVVSRGSGSLSAFKLFDDWTLENIDQVTHRSIEQKSPDPHHVKTSPDNSWIIVTDKSTNYIYTYELVKGVVLREVDRVQLGEEFDIAGFDFHPHLDIAYAISKSRGEIITMEYSPKVGSFSPFLNMSTLAEAALGEDQAEENQATQKMVIDSKGSSIYVLNQKKPSIAVYNIHPKAGATQLQQVYGLERDQPYDLYLASDDKHLIVSYLGQSIGTLLDIDSQTGQLLNERNFSLNNNKIKFFSFT